MTSGSFWNYRRNEVNCSTGKIDNNNNLINNNKTITINSSNNKNNGKHIKQE